MALRTIDDMCKAVDRGMVITDVKLLQKHGGKTGSWVAVNKLGVRWSGLLGSLRARAGPS